MFSATALKMPPCRGIIKVKPKAHRIKQDVCRMKQDKKILLNPALNPVVSRVLLYRNLAISLSILIS